MACGLRCCLVLRRRHDREWHCPSSVEHLARWLLPGNNYRAPASDRWHHPASETCEGKMVGRALAPRLHPARPRDSYPSIFYRCVATCCANCRSQLRAAALSNRTGSCSHQEAGGLRNRRPLGLNSQSPLLLGSRFHFAATTGTACVLRASIVPCPRARAGS